MGVDWSIRQNVLRWQLNLQGRVMKLIVSTLDALVCAFNASTSYAACEALAGPRVDWLGYLLMRANLGEANLTNANLDDANLAGSNSR